MKRKTLDEIVDAVSDYLDVEFDVPVIQGHWGKGLRGSNRASRARHIAVYITRTMTERSLWELAHDFGFLDHTSILYALNRTAGDKTMRADASAIMATLKMRGRSAP